MPAKTRRCPQCGKPAAVSGDPAAPFCSKRCKLNDLARWLGGDYCISTPLGGGFLPPDPDENDG